MYPTGEQRSSPRFDEEKDRRDPQVDTVRQDIFAFPSLSLQTVLSSVGKGRKAETWKPKACPMSAFGRMYLSLCAFQTSRFSPFRRVASKTNGCVYSLLYKLYELSTSITLITPRRVFLRCCGSNCLVPPQECLKNTPAHYQFNTILSSEKAICC